MSHSSLDARKKRLRETMRRVIEPISAREALAAGEAISDRLKDSADWRTASMVALFAGIHGEIDTRPLMEMTLRAGKQLLVPRMLDARTLEFAVVEEPDSLRPGSYGVPEPDRRSPARLPDEDALICIPGLAFDRRGGRLGRGAGYYDRTLAAHGEVRGRPRLMGIAFECQIIEWVPMGSLDVRMDSVMTEARHLLTA